MREGERGEKGDRGRVWCRKVDGHVNFVLPPSNDHYAMAYSDLQRSKRG